MSVNWDAERRIAQDVEDNEELYRALADSSEDDE
jgi:hypothetical protein